MYMKRMIVSCALTVAATLFMGSTAAVAQNTGVYYTANSNVNSVSTRPNCAATGNCRPRLNNGVIDTPVEKALFPRKACCPWNNPIAIRCRR